MDRFVAKAEMLRIVGLTYPTVWQWMQRGDFPRSRVLGGNGPGARVAWLKESELNAWIESRPVKHLKGDPPEPRPRRRLPK